MHCHVLNPFELIVRKVRDTFRDTLPANNSFIYLVLGSQNDHVPFSIWSKMIDKIKKALPTSSHFVVTRYKRYVDTKSETNLDAKSETILDIDVETHAKCLSVETVVSQTTFSNMSEAFDIKIRNVICKNLPLQNLKPQQHFDEICDCTEYNIEWSPEVSISFYEKGIIPDDKTKSVDNFNTITITISGNNVTDFSQLESLLGLLFQSNKSFWK